MNIHRTISHALILATLAFGASAQETPAPVLEDGTQLILAGAGSYENLGERIYIGGLYLPLLDMAIKPGQSKRMQMRIAAESLSARRFVRFWTDGITLNSTREERAVLVEEITAFGDLLQSDLQRGDHVSFDYLSGAEETAVLLNGVLLGKIAGAEFHQVLLKAWIGDTPPSASLKAGLLNGLDGKSADAIRAEFESLAYSPERFAEINDRFDKRRQLELEAQAAAEEAARLAEQERLAEKARQEELAREQEEARIAARAAAEAEKIRAEEERKIHEAQQKVLSEEYREALIQWLVQHVTYPSYSLQKGDEGRVELSIVAGRGGEVLSRELTLSSGNELLDKATMDMVEKATPLPPMPAELDGDSFAFVMPVNFTLED